MTLPVFGLYAAKHCTKTAAARLLNCQVRTALHQRDGPPKLDRIATVEIDHGRFKYLMFLIKEDPEENPGTTGRTKNIIRGYADCQYHMNIYERVTESCQMLGFKIKCAGGGELIHDAKKKHIIVFGKSEKYGQADHCWTKNLLQLKYTDYQIEICDRV